MTDASGPISKGAIEGFLLVANPPKITIKTCNSMLVMDFSLSLPSIQLIQSRQLIEIFLGTPT